MIDFQRIFEDCCLGNKEAFEFLRAFLLFVHAADDVIDADKPIDSENFLLVNMEWVRCLSFNSFYQEHKASLYPLIAQSVNDYADSNLWAKRSDFRDRASSDVLKSNYQQIFYQVALLCGGWDHMREMSKKHRVYDYDSAG